jgi:hypothetical protein
MVISHHSATILVVLLVGCAILTYGWLTRDKDGLAIINELEKGG